MYYVLLSENYKYNFCYLDRVLDFMPKVGKNIIRLTGRISVYTNDVICMYS